MFKKATIKLKLIALMIIPIVMFVMMSGYSFYSLNAMTNRFNVFIDTTYQTVNDIKDARIAVLTIQRSINRLYILGFDHAEASIDLQEIEKDINVVNNYLDKLFAAFPNEQTVMSNYEQAINNWIDHVDLAIQAGQNGDLEAGEQYLAETTSEVNKIAAIARQLESKTLDAVDVSTADFENMATLTMLVLVIFAVIVIILTLVIGLATRKSIMRPIQLITDAYAKVNEGDLNVKIEYNSNDELGKLSLQLDRTIRRWKTVINVLVENFELFAQGDLNVGIRQEFAGDFAPLKSNLLKIAENMNETLTQISDASTQVTFGSQQMANASQTLAQGATYQASSVQELSASLQEISNHVKASATNAQEANTRANEIGQYIDRSNAQMNEMMKAMDVITDKSNEISKIIKTIDNIAFQTNILALNAAVEAARAGNAGKGFAVVADEVRNLASKSAEAAKDTTALIKETIEAVEHGTKIADETAASMVDVVRGTSSIVSLVSGIAAASNEQATSIGQINQGVDQISGVVQTNSATSEESAATAEELLGQAEMLKQLISHFKLREESNNNTIEIDQVNHENISATEMYVDVSNYKNDTRKTVLNEDYKETKAVKEQKKTSKEIRSLTKERKEATEGSGKYD